MKAFITFILLLLLTISSYAQTGQQKVSIAIMDFQNTSGKANLDYLQKSIPEALITRLAESGNLNIVERTRLEDAIEEMKLGMAGVVDQGAAAEIGKAVGANAILVGSFIEISYVIRLNARLIDVQTSKVMTAKTVQGQVGAEIFNLMDGLAKSIEEQLVGKKPEPKPQPTPTPTPQPQPMPVTKNGGSKTGLYIAGGALVVGGAVAAVLLLSKKEKEKTSTDVEIIVPLGGGR